MIVLSMEKKGPFDIGLAEELEFETSLALWCEVFNQPAEVFTGMYGSCPPERRRTFVAKEAGKPVASVQLYALPIRDEQGDPVLVGCIANVSTRSTHRGHGLSTRLLELSLEAMGELGCGWSFLFTGIPGFYARLGWRNAAYKTWSLPALESTSDAPWRELHGDYGLLPELYAVTQSTTPLSLVRSEGDWSVKLPGRLDQRKVLYGERCGYALVRDEPERTIVEEWGFVGGECDPVLAQLRGAGKPVSIVAPWSRPTPDAVPSEEGAGMVRPVGEEWSHERLAALFARPDARFYGIDGF